MITVDQVRVPLDLTDGKPEWADGGFGTSIPHPLIGMAEVGHRADFQLDVSIKFALPEIFELLSPEHLKIHAVTFERLLPGITITSELMRKVPLGRITTAVLSKSLAIRTEDGRLGPASQFSVPAEIQSRWPDQVDDELLHYIGCSYRISQFLGLGPTAEIASKFNVSRATAGRMVDAARRAGWIEPLTDRATLADEHALALTIQWSERASGLNAPNGALSVDAPDYNNLDTLRSVFNTAKIYTRKVM